METIYDILKEEHEQMSDLLRQALQDGSKVSFFKVKLKADPHMMGEERIFYPVLEEINELRELMSQAHKEHDETKTLIFEIEGMDEINEKWTSKINELKQSIEHHIEEEESKVFEKARNILSQEKAEEMAQQYIEFKRSYMNRIETGGPFV
ncbi:MAG TPA: hemerythrin domain-containing protein [Methanosarcina vacuolata]|uniref:hemerythrin domain-containing protein n=1 Tax=Methanosarcina sp. DH1 TaxID=2605695 RepID=UPI001E5B7563|nr:hemerythrin domain-containing protein [Methanosarcina sp. DH1]MCC4765816.1 hemerythrin domain-containing protein [Methanosarcina sp. DH1]HPS88475.1 hemerythrin domain-containing protein [Methanosarcina vacuolata]